MAVVLNSRNLPNGLTELVVGVGASTRITLQIATDQWQTMTADTLDQIIAGAVDTHRPPIGRR